jgi:RNA polymerase sigma-70 factor (ECF subfamily)
VTAEATFAQERPRLVRIARRMLGTLDEAEDVVQTAWLRFASADLAAIDRPEAWLTRTVSRLAIDTMRSARARREVYVGPWLPEPLIEDEGEGEDQLTTALLLALERLSPLERAAFLLHDVFAVPFGEVASALDRDEAACRQLAARARRHVASARPRFTVPPKQGTALVEAFLEASRSGDVAGLSKMLAENARLVADGGGIRPAAPQPILGRDSIARFFAEIAKMEHFTMPEIVRFALIDGLPGVVTREEDGLLQITSLQIGPDGIEAVYVIRNPEKLHGVGG